MKTMGSYIKNSRSKRKRELVTGEATPYYIDQLKRWLEHFPKEQILLLQSEDFLNNPE